MFIKKFSFSDFLQGNNQTKIRFTLADFKFLFNF